MFSHNGPMARRVYSYAAIEYDKHNSRDSYQILLNDKDQQVLIVSFYRGRCLLSMISFYIYLFVYLSVVT